MNRGIAILLRSLSKERILKSIGGCILLLIGITVATTLILDIPKAAVITLSIVSFLIVQFGFIILWKANSSYLKNKNEILFLLEDDLESIVWIYYNGIIEQSYGFKFSQTTDLHIGLINGQKISVNIARDELDELTTLLKYHLPNASFGYSRSKEQLYKISPQLLQGDIV